MTPVQTVDPRSVPRDRPVDPRRGTGDDPGRRPTCPGAGAFLLRSPGLIMLANVSILEGYRWLGFISSPGGAGPAGILSSRTVTAVLSGLLLSAAAVLTRPGPGMRRSPVPRTVVAAGVMVVITSSLVLLGEGARAGDALGVADLALAVAAIATVVSDGIGRRQWPTGCSGRHGMVGRH